MVFIFCIGFTDMNRLLRRNDILPVVLDLYPGKLLQWFRANQEAEFPHHCTEIDFNRKGWLNIRCTRPSDIHCGEPFVWAHLDDAGDAGQGSEFVTGTFAFCLRDRRQQRRFSCLEEEWMISQNGPPGRNWTALMCNFRVFFRKLTDWWETDQSHSGISTFHHIKSFSFLSFCLIPLNQLCSVFGQLRFQKTQMIFRSWNGEQHWRWREGKHRLHSCCCFSYVILPVAQFNIRYLWIPICVPLFFCVRATSRSISAIFSRIPMLKPVVQVGLHKSDQTVLDKILNASTTQETSEVSLTEAVGNTGQQRDFERGKLVMARWRTRR